MLLACKHTHMGCHVNIGKENYFPEALANIVRLDREMTFSSTMARCINAGNRPSHSHMLQLNEQSTTQPLNLTQ